MTARRFMFAFIVIASLTIGMYAQGGGAAAPAQGGGGGGRGGGAAAPAAPTPGNLVVGAWGSSPLPVDSRGWGWMTKAYVNPKTPRPFYNQAKENLGLQCRAVLRIAQALGLHLV